MRGTDERARSPSRVNVVSSSPSVVTVSIVDSSCPQPLRAYRITPQGLVDVSPNAAMGAFLDKPKTCKQNTTGEGKVRAPKLFTNLQGLRYSVASMQGWRVDMEDAHVVKVSINEEGPFSDWSFFAVFDGHAGSVAADDAAERLLSSLLAAPRFKEAVDEMKEHEGKMTKKALDLMEEGMKQGFLALDELIRETTSKAKDRSGTTAVCAILTPSHFIIANLVLSRRGQEAFGTTDHKPYHEKERARIVGAGGSVMIQRINGSLAVSRAFGDFEYKAVPGLDATRQLVSAEPDIYALERNKEIDEFLVLACDGVYDVMENAELCSFVESRLHVCSDLSQVCNQVLDACLSRGSRDNMTMILVCFDAAPTICEEKVKAEQRWIELVRQATEELVNEEVTKDTYRSDEEMSIETLLRQLSQRSLEAPPPGAGIHSMRAIVEKVLGDKGIPHE